MTNITMLEELDQMENVLENEVVTDLHTILDILRWTLSRFNSSKIFYGHGTDNSWDETLRLVLPSLFLPLDFPSNMYNAKITSNERARIINQVIRRIYVRTPVSYLVNTAWFCNLEFYVDPKVLIPRSPLSQIIMNKFLGLLSRPPKYILDMCTGSGCIAIAIASIYKNSKIDAVDISSDALSIAEYNIQLHNLENRVIPILSNLFNNLKSFVYDLIISNPPYISKEEMDNLPKEFLFEPKIGLIADNDGLKIIQCILKKASSHLTIDGVLICEVGDNKNKLVQLYPKIQFCWLKFSNYKQNAFKITYKELVKNFGINK